MEALILGLLLFLGTHSIGLVARPWRNHMVNRLGETPWKLLYTVVSLVGFILIIALETWLGDAARVWQGVTLAAMLVAASGVALVRRYRRNRQRRAMDERLRRAEESDP